ncbi:hypothetical protein PILCRDRAFT_1762 [Piloderma croceum F 1598]|uniref:Uncharacterized protein n=1 Tax=Piloderma croceum (strain F 1598) TaxID=765440 RepID=A0A0C3GIK0_PILCF|nr:hypothetical protein PILCRDRAFT_1762 [Piloderma croceum F 1598]
MTALTGKMMTSLSPSRTWERGSGAGGERVGAIRAVRDVVWGGLDDCVQTRWEEDDGG